MKRIKRIMLSMITAMTLCFMFANVITVNAATEKVPGGVYVDTFRDAKNNIKETTKMELVLGNTYNLDVEFGGGDRIANLKVKKSGGVLPKVTYTYNNYRPATETYVPSGDATISLYAAKTGKYTLSFDVVNNQGVVRRSCKVTLLVRELSGAYKKVTFGGKTVLSASNKLKKGVRTSTSESEYRVTGESGNIKLTPNSKYKITGLVVASIDKNGTYTYKKIKNGGKITLSKLYQYQYHASNGYDDHDSKKYTCVYVSYKNTFTGDSVKYSVSKAKGKNSRGIKEIKCVRVTKKTGLKTTSYYTGGSGCDIILWQY